MEPLKAIIAEDEQLTRTIIRARLEKLGHTVVAEAEDGVQVVEAARLYRPDVVILDIKMPNMDGIEAARMILAENPCAILFLSSFDEEELVQQASEAGALAYLLKPFRKEDLGPALEIAMSRFRQIQSLSKEIDNLKDTLESRKLIERAKGILMDRHGMSEDEAFKRIHFQARNQNKKMKDIAQSIITAADLI
ncbi:MAG: response regulator [Chthonomonadaceae bacterium]|nr:response regulator [Chthonomonadaceae bacterium]